MLLADLTDFIDRDRPHGTLAGDATATELGYLLTVQCECSVAVMRWVTARMRFVIWCGTERVVRQ